MEMYDKIQELARNVVQLVRGRDEAIQRAEQAEKRAEENVQLLIGAMKSVCVALGKPDGDGAWPQMCAHIAELRSELDRLRGEMAGVAERQREVCAASVGSFAGASRIVRETPLVTDSKEPEERKEGDRIGTPEGCGADCPKKHCPHCDRHIAPASPPTPACGFHACGQPGRIERFRRLSDNELLEAPRCAKHTGQCNRYWRHVPAPEGK